MKNRTILVMLLFGLVLPDAVSFGSEFPIDTIMYSGPKENRINFVFLSDGYQKHELPKFLLDVDSSVAYFFGEPPFSNYKNYFNVFAISVPSRESGASHPRTAPDCPDSIYHPRVKVDNYFGSSFDANNIHRLLVSYRSDSIYNVLMRNFPDYGQAFVLVNTPHYGGSGGGIPVSSTNYASSEVVMHEFSHSFAQLSDEYGGNCTYKSLLGKNVTDKKDYLQIPWNSWLDAKTPLPTPATGDYLGIPGLYEGAYYCDTGWYRPMIDCKMRSLYTKFCVACKQLIIERIHELVSPVDSYMPKDLFLETGDTTLNFRANIVRPEPNTIETLWYLDSAQVSGSDSLVLSTKTLPEGFSSITVLINDTTGMTRDTAHIYNNIHKQIIHWEILKNSTGISIDGNTSEISLKVFPNPFTESINIEVTTGGRDVTAILADLSGNIVGEWSGPGLVDGNKIRITISSAHLLPGYYRLILKSGKAMLGSDLLKIGK